MGVYDERPSAGWFADPLERAELRFWSGTGWTTWISDGTAVLADLRPLRRHLGPTDLAHLEFIDQVFLPEARSQALVSPQADQQLAALTQQLRLEAGRRQLVAAGPARGAEAPAGVAPATARWPGGPRETPVAAPRPGGPVGPAPGPQPQPVVRSVPQPGPVTRWWDRTRSAVSSDLTVHGLAYLGVLLLFVGAFGLVVFAFGDVAPRLRPVAELVIAAAPFAAAALLLHRGARIAGRALEVGGGLLLPVVIVTTLVDGFGFPPDLTDVPLVVALTAGSALITAGYAVWSRRHPASALRYLVAPMAWFTVAMATLGLGRDIPVGKDVATPSSAQVAAIAVALVVTLALARARPSSRLSGPTQVSAITGTGLLAVMAILTWAAEDWPPTSIGATGALLLVALHLLRPRLPASVVATAGPLWAVVVGSALAVQLEPAPVAAALLLTFVGLLEVAGTTRWPRWAVVLPAAGALVSLVTTLADPWWAVGAFSAAALWSVARRVHPYDEPVAAVGFDVAAVVLPLAALVPLGAALQQSVALAAGAGLTILVTVPARRPVLRRGEDDSFWTLTSWLWLAVVAAATGLFVVAAQETPFPAAGASVFEPGRDGWLVTATFIVLAAAATIGPLPRLGRPWAVGALVASAWLTTCQTAALPDVARGVVLAGAGLALVVAAHVDVGRVARDALAQVGLVGHVVGAVALVASGPRWGLVASLGLATTGWAVTAVRDRDDRSPVGAALADLDKSVRLLPPVMALVGLPVTAALALDRAGVVALDDPWMVWVPAVAALGYGALSRLRLGNRLQVVSAWGGFAAALTAAAIATDRTAAVVGLGAVVVTPAFVAVRRRHPLMVWTGWLAVAPLAAAVAGELSDRFDALAAETQVSSVLVVVGAALLIGGYAAEVRRRGWAARQPVPVSSGVLPVVTLGATELVLGILGAALAVQGDVGAWLVAAAAAGLLVVGLLTRTGVLGGAAALLGWYSAVRLLAAELETRPWVGVLVVALLLVIAGLLARRTGQVPVWSRWDTWLLLAAGPVAITALVQATDGDFYTATYVLVGVECAAAAAGLRRRPLASVGLGIVSVLLVLEGAGYAGDGWLTLTMLGFSVTSSALAVRATGAPRRLLQLAGAGFAAFAWPVALSWFSWSATMAVDVTVVGAGALTLSAAALLLVRDVDQYWSTVWGVTGAVLAVLGTVAAEGMRSDGEPGQPSWWVVTGMVLLTVATASAAGPLAMTWLRDLAAFQAVVTALIALQVGDLQPSGQVTALVVVSVVCGLAGLAMPERPALAEWRRPALELGSAAAVLSIVVAAADLPDRLLLVPSLAAASLQAALLGTALRLLLPQLLSPLLACAAWWAYASEALDGNPQWYTVPIGLSLLVAVALWRRHRQLLGGDPTAPEIVALELAGIAFLVGAAFVQAITEVVGYAALAAVLGIAVAGWGLVTQVRRRLLAGVAVVAAALVVFVVVPMAQLLPAWEGVWLWLLIGAVGVVALLAATMLEEGREVVRRGVGRFAQITEHWE